MVTMAQRIEALRTEKGLSRPALAAALGLPRLSIEKFETGRQTPSQEQQQKLAGAFGVSLPYLRGETDDPTSMDNWLSGAVPQEDVVLPKAVRKATAAVVAQSGDSSKSDGAVFSALLKSDSFKALVPGDRTGRLKIPRRTGPAGKSRQKVKKQPRICLQTDSGPILSLSQKSLCGLDRIAEIPDDLHRPLSHRRFSGDHHRSGAVCHSVENIADLRPGGHRILLHGRQHLRHHHEWLPRLAALGLDPLLGRRQLPQGHGIPQIPSGNDDLIRRFQKFREPFQPHLVFRSCEQPDIRSAVSSSARRTVSRSRRLRTKGCITPVTPQDAATRIFSTSDAVIVGRVQIRSRQSQTLSSPQNAASKGPLPPRRSQSAP